LPLDLLGLDLGSSLEVNDGLLEHVLLGVVHTEARDHIDLGWVVSIRLLVVVHGLEFVLLLLVEVSHLGQNIRVGWHLGDEDVVPLQGLSSHTNQFVNVSDLIDNFVTVWDDSVKLFESLQTFVIVAESLVNETQVVDSLDTVGFYSNSFKEELFTSVIVFVNKKTITLVNEGSRVVSIVLNGQVSELLGILEVVFKEVQERNVVGSHSHHDLVLLLESLEGLNSSLDFLVLDVMDRLSDFHLRFDLRQVSSLESLNDVVVSIDNVFFDEWSNHFGGLRDIVQSLLLLLLQVVLEWISLPDWLFGLVL
jgi:hypothetical protein